MHKLVINVVFTGAKTVTFTDTFEAVVEKILTDDAFKDLTPLKLTFTTDKVLFFDRELFEAFQEGGLHYSELIQQTECDGLYRNWFRVTYNGVEIEAGALWVLRGNVLTMVDNDEFATFTLPNQAFEPI